LHERNGMAGTLSGVKAAIHCGNELWFGIGMEVSERDRNLAIKIYKYGKKWTMCLYGIELQ